MINLHITSNTYKYNYYIINIIQNITTNYTFQLKNNINNIQVQAFNKNIAIST